MTAATRQRKPRRSPVIAYAVASSRGKTVPARTYEAALLRASEFEGDRLCERIEIFKGGGLRQWWTRDLLSEWEFHGTLFEGGRS